MRPTSCLMNLQTHKHTGAVTRERADKITTGVHVLGTSTRGTLHPRCIAMKVLYETGSWREAEVRSGHMGTTHGDIRQEESKTADLSLT